MQQSICFRNNQVDSKYLRAAIYCRVSPPTLERLASQTSSPIGDDESRSKASSSFKSWGTGMSKSSMDFESYKYEQDESRIHREVRATRGKSYQQKLSVLTLALTCTVGLLVAVLQLFMAILVRG